MGDNDNNDGKGNDGKGGGGNEYKPPSSQEEFDSIVGQRLARERAKFGDYDELKSKAAQFDENEAKNASALEKAQKEATDATSKASGLGVQLLEERVEAAVLRAAKNLVDPDAAARLIDRSAIEYDDAGKPTNIGPLLDALVKEKPYLKAKGVTTSSRPRQVPANEADDGDDGTKTKREGKARANEALLEHFAR